MMKFKNHLKRNVARNARRNNAPKSRTLSPSNGGQHATPLLQRMAGAANSRPDDFMFVIAHLADGPAQSERDPNADGSSKQVLEALNVEFRASLDWSSSTANKGDSITAETCVAQIRPLPEFTSDGTRHVVAFHRDYYRGDDAVRRRRLQDFWEHQINRRPPTIEFVKSALPIWQIAEISVPNEAITHAMQLTTADAATIDAIHAALFSAAITSLGHADLDIALYAIAVFLHSHPAFEHSVAKTSVPPPFGDETVYDFADLLK